jgi:hypothetical protein
MNYKVVTPRKASCKRSLEDCKTGIIGIGTKFMLLIKRRPDLRYNRGCIRKLNTLLHLSRVQSNYFTFSISIPGLNSSLQFIRADPHPQQLQSSTRE